MSLKEKISKAKEPKTPAVVLWLRSLDEEEWEYAWQALTDDKTFTTYGLLDIFNEEGGRFGKASFVPFRRSILAGEITKEQIRGSK